ncbi:MAG: exodeoxyribonuclease VII small subunit [Firmicutes bacterium]|nr:exodeoxyribonuclease VII small subunit [Bacillota bacterium]
MIDESQPELSTLGEDLSFEDRLQRLEGIVHALEEGNLSLDEAMRRFEEGVHLVRLLEEELKNAEVKIHHLMNDQEETER